MNPILQKTEAAIEAKINPPQLKPVVEKLVAAGRKIMYADQTRHLMVDQMNGPGDDFEKIGSGVAKLVGLVMSQTKGTAPPQALVPAGILLMCEAMGFLEDAGRIQVTNDTVAQTMQETSSSLLQMLGVTPDKLQQMFAKAQGAGGAAPVTAGGAPGAAAPPTPAAAPAKGIIGSAIGGV